MSTIIFPTCTRRVPPTLLLTRSPIPQRRSISLPPTSSTDLPHQHHPTHPALTLTPPLQSSSSNTIIPRPRHRTRSSLHSPETYDVFPDIWAARRFPSSSEVSAAAATDNNKVDPFWKAYRSSHITTSGSGNEDVMRFSRDRANVRLGRELSTVTKGEKMKGDAEENGKMALIFAGLGSYPHLPTSPTPASLHIWSRASSALLTPSSSMGYIPTASLINEFGPIAPSNDDTHTHGSAWLRGWMAGGRTLKDLMKRPDLTSAFVLTSSVAVLASAQEATDSPSLLPRSTSQILGHGFIGTLTCLVVTGKISLEDAVRLCRIYALLPPSSENETSSEGFMTTLLTISSDPSQIRRYSLSEPDSHFQISSSLCEKDNEPMSRVLRIIHNMQVSEGWNENLMNGYESGAEEMMDGGRGEVKEWAGEAMINSHKTLVVSGTKGAVIKIIDRLRAGGLATPVMDLYMPAPFHTPLMRHSIHQFRDHLKGCTFYPQGGAPPAGWLNKGVEPEVTILDGMTCQPLDLTDIASSLTAYLTRPLLWGDTTRSLWCSSTDSPSHTLNIRTVGKGTRGLGMQIDREIRSAAAAITTSSKPQQVNEESLTVRVQGGGRQSRATRMTVAERPEGMAKVQEFGVRG